MGLVEQMHPVWKMLISGQRDVNLTYLPAKILLYRWRTKLSIDGNEADIVTGASELFNIYLQGQALPNAKRDIEAIMGNA